jgi:hypothetical protein
VIVITKKIELSINPQDCAFCEGCDFLSSECTPYCDLYREWLGWDFIRCVRCLNDFGEGENDEH